MSIDYDDFRTKDWPERLALFNEASAEEKAELVRTHATRWLESHRAELTAAQVELVHRSLELVRPEAYRPNRDPALLDRLKEFEKEAAALFTREQRRQGLTLHLEGSCGRRPR